MNSAPNRRPLDIAKSLIRRGSGYIPAALLDILLSQAMDLMLKRHRAVFRKLSAFSGRKISIRLTEFAFSFLLRLHPERPSLVSRSANCPVESDATIKGDFRALIGMLEGKLDGDAMFFSRDLVIEGNTEVVLALRNAVDGAGIDLLEDFCSIFGSAAGPAEAILRRAAMFGARLEHVLGRSA